MKTSNIPTVSIVITTKNEEKNIRNCLNSIKKQTYPQSKIEVIVVDNGSIDNTKQIALKYTAKVFNEGPERSAQRNYGAKKSSGKYFMYLDADMILSPGVIKESMNILEKDDDVVALYIPEIIMGDTFWSKVRRFERSFYNGTVIDCVRFVKLEVFKKVGGFDETMSGPEDWDIDKKVRQIGKTSSIKSSIYHNESEFNLKLYLVKKKYYANSFETYIKKWGKNNENIKKQFGLYYRFYKIFTEHGKWKKILQHPILTVGMLLLRFLVGLSYVSVSLKRTFKLKK